MLLSNAMPRAFTFQHNNEKIKLEDPNLSWSPEDVLNFYIPHYPILATATIHRPVLIDDEQVIEFSPTIGTKG